jgi:hypothetical protein
LNTIIRDAGAAPAGAAGQYAPCLKSITLTVRMTIMKSVKTFQLST